MLKKEFDSKGTLNLDFQTGIGSGLFFLNAEPKFILRFGPETCSFYL